MKILLKKLRRPVIVFLCFLTAGTAFYLIKGHGFLFFNFLYIGTGVCTGVIMNYMLPKEKKHYARRTALVFLGLYLFVYIGFMRRENIMLEGFFLALLTGVLNGAAIHFIVAKMVGPLVFGRGFCSWACWTAMLLDFLPWKESPGRVRRLGILRYIHFILSLGIVLWFFVFQSRDLPSGEQVLLWIGIGGIAYYALGILLAFILKDNRAFCKYLCPVTPVLKLFSRFSLIKVSIDKEKCTDCGICEKSCPMDVRLTAYRDRESRVLSTECIGCLNCVNLCPREAACHSLKIDGKLRDEILRYRR